LLNSGSKCGWIQTEETECIMPRLVQGPGKCSRIKFKSTYSGLMDVAYYTDYYKFTQKGIQRDLLDIALLHDFLKWTFQIRLTKPFPLKL